MGHNTKDWLERHHEESIEFERALEDFASHESQSLSLFEKLKDRVVRGLRMWALSLVNRRMKKEPWNEVVAKSISKYVEELRIEAEQNRALSKYLPKQSDHKED